MATFSNKIERFFIVSLCINTAVAALTLVALALTLPRNHSNFVTVNGVTTMVPSMWETVYNGEVIVLVASVILASISMIGSMIAKRR